MERSSLRTKGPTPMEPSTHGVDSFRHLAEALPQIVWTAGPDGIVDYLSPQYSRFTYVPIDDPDYLNGVTYVHPDDRKPGLLAWARALRTGKAFESEYRLKGGDGKYYWFAARATPVRDHNGEIVKWYGSGIDIDKQKRAELAQLAIAAEKDEFIAMLSHELRNPLAAITSSSDILHNPSSASEQKHSALKLIKGQIDQFTKLVDDILDISRLNLGLLEISKEEVEISQLTTQCVDEITSNLVKKQLTITPRINSTQIWVEGDRKRLTQCITNLLSNASKYTNPGGNIDISIETESDKKLVSIIVKDTGIGLSDKEIDRLFEPYHQGRYTQYAANSGLGLGLAMIKELVSLHHGKVSAQSDGIGKGSTFIITLPTTDPPQDLSAENATEKATTLPLRRTRYSRSQTIPLNTPTTKPKSQSAKAIKATDDPIPDEDNFRHLAEALPQIIWTAKPDGVVDYISSQHTRYTGVTLDDPDYWNGAAIVHPDDWKIGYYAWVRAIKREEIYEAEYRMKAADGTYHWFAARGIPVKNSEGKVIKWYGSTNDIHRLKQAELDLQNTVKNKDTFIATLSRKLRNPLTALSTSYQILETGQPSSQQQAEALGQLDQETKHLRHLLNDTLDISRLNSPKSEVLIKDTSEELPPQSNEDESSVTSGPLQILIIEDNESVALSLEMFLQLEGHLVHVAGDGESAFQLLTDISPDIIFCDLSLPGQFQGWDIAEKICQDSPCDHLPYLIALSGHTQPHHLEKCRKAGFKQHLAKPASPEQLRNGILQALPDLRIKGDASLTSISPLPPSVSDDLSQEAAPADSPSLQILIIEDNESVALSLEMFFQLEGHHPRIAGDGASALQLLSEIRPDMIFCDLSLPGELQGWDIAEKIRQAPPCGHTPYLVALSGYSQLQHRETCRRAGFDEHMSKPASPDALREVIDLALNTLGKDANAS